MEWLPALTVIGVIVAIIGIQTGCFWWMINRIDKDVRGQGERIDQMGVRIDQMGASIDQTQAIIMRMLEKQGR